MPDAHWSPRTRQPPIDLWIPALVALAFVLRIVARLWHGRDAYVEDGYHLFLVIAQRFVGSGELCLDVGQECARRMPLYPLLMGPFVAGGSLYPWLPVTQAALGAILVWVVAATTRESVGGRWPARLSAMLAALSPYAVVHDTAMQDTVLVNVFVMLAVYFGIRAARNPVSLFASLAVGLSVALGIVTTARIALVLLPILGVAVVTMLRALPGRSVRRRVALVIAAVVPVVLLVGGWTVRNRIVEGEFLLTTETGRSLWVANNAHTFHAFPARSIDESAAFALDQLDASSRAELAIAGKSSRAQDAVFAGWARRYMVENPSTILEYAARKIWVVVSAMLSPARSTAVQLGYALGMTVVHLLAAVGLLHATFLPRGQRAVIAALLLGFFATTAVFWAHTSHKSAIDGPLFVCAAWAFARTRERWRSRNEIPANI